MCCYVRDIFYKNLLVDSKFGFMENYSFIEKHGRYKDC